MYDPARTELLEVSIHALLAESDRWAFVWTTGETQFLSTLSLRRATRPGQRLQSVTRFLSTLSLRRATPLRPPAWGCHSGFYPRSPCGERRIFTEYIKHEGRFLSTLSLRRATTDIKPPNLSSMSVSIHALLAESDENRPRPSARIYGFYPRSPCGERHNINSSVNTADKVSIHALLAESDFRAIHNAEIHKLFLSTLSLRRATESIRTLRTVSVSFYPRSPCGERQQKCTKQWGTFAHMEQIL